MPEPTAETEAVTPRDNRAIELVALAYESLIDARTATLLIEGIGRVGAEAAAGITLCERAGRPVLLCPAVGVLADATSEGCAAVLTVPTMSPSGTVIFLGRLQNTGVHGCGAERTAVLELAPASIVVEPDSGCPDDTDDAGRLEHVDLPLYTAHCRRPAPREHADVPGDALDSIAERIRVHTNQHHHDALLEAVLRLGGVARDAVAGATLAGVDRAGVLLDWTDEAGGHRLVLSFTSPAHDSTTLSRSVREVLEGRR